MTSLISLICSCSIHLFAATPRHISLEAIESKCSTWHLGSCAIWVENQGVKVKSSKNVYRVLENTSIYIYIYRHMYVYQCMYNEAKYIWYVYIYISSTLIHMYVCMYKFIIYIYIWCLYIYLFIYCNYILCIYVFYFFGMHSKIEMSFFALAFGDNKQKTLVEVGTDQNHQKCSSPLHLVRIGQCSERCLNRANLRTIRCHHDFYISSVNHRKYAGNTPPSMKIKSYTFPIGTRFAPPDGTKLRNSLKSTWDHLNLSTVLAPETPHVQICGCSFILGYSQ